MSFLKKAAGFVLGAVGAVAGFVVAGPAGAAIGFSIGMGIGTAIQMQAMKTKVPDVSSATGARLNVSIDPDEYRKICFGETALGTDQRYWESWGPEKSYFDQVIAAAGHEIESFGKLYFDDEEVTFSGDTATGVYAGVLTKQDRVVGVTGTALTVGAGSLWTSAASMTGVAHYALRIRWSQEKFPRGIPSRITRVGKGAKVYDPRRDSTQPGGSGSHRANDQSTWEYSPTDSNGVPIGRNPALQILWYEIGWRVQNPVTSEWILVCGRGRPLDDINFAQFITAANDCEDEEYYSDVQLSTGDAHETNIAVLEAACAGKLMDNGGRIGLRIRTDTTGDIVQAFTDGDVLDQDASDWIPSEDMPQRWNQGIGSFVDPAALYKLIPLPTVRDTTYEAEDGFRRPGPAFRFDAVQSAAQAQKLIRLELNMSRYQGVFTAPFNWRAKKVQVWDCVTLTFPRLGFEDRIFRVLEKKTDPMGAIWLLLREDDPSVYTPGTVNPVPAPSPGAGYDPRATTQPDAGDWTVTPAYIEGGGAKIPSLLLAGTGIAPNIVSTKVFLRLGIGGDWVLKGTYDSRQSIRVALTDLVPAGSYYVGLVYQNAYGVSSAMTTLGPYSAPADFVALSSLISDSFVGQGALATLSQVTWATQVTGTGKPEDFATLSRVYRQDTAPSSPNTNDIWVQTAGGAPIAVRAWNGSAWVTGADITLINTAAGILGQDWGATASEVAASNARVPVGANALIDTEFQRITYAWRDMGPGNVGISLAVGFDLYGSSQRPYFAKLGTGTPTAGTRFDLLATRGMFWAGVSDLPNAKRFGVRVVPGERWYVGALVASSGCSAVEVYVQWTNDAGVDQVYQLVDTGTGPPSVGDFSTWEQVGGFVTVPAGKAFAFIYVTALTSGAANPFAAMSSPMIVRVSAVQTEIPIYMPGRPDPIADVTNTNTAAAIAGQGTDATANTGRGNTAGRPASTGAWNKYLNTETGWLQWDVPVDGWINVAKIGIDVTAGAKIGAPIPSYTGPTGSNRSTSAATLNLTGLTGSITYFWSVTSAADSDIVAVTPGSATCVFRCSSLGTDRLVSIQCIVTASEGTFVASGTARWTVV